MSPTQLTAYFASRWHSKVNLDRLFWRDMLLVGTLLNLLASFSALMLMAFLREPAWALALHFSTLPYNAFLLATIWRFPAASPAVRFSASAWFGVMLVA